MELAMDALLLYFLFFGVALVTPVVFLAIALVSLKGTQPADRPAILRALATMIHRK
jgi:hypothetical protein